MKLYIKMTKAETGQWDALKDAAKPPEMPDSEFARVLFYRGVNTFMEELTDKINSLSEEEKAKILEEEGAEVSEISETEEKETSSESND